MPDETTGTRKAGARAVAPCPFCGRLNRVDLGRVEHRPTCGECGRPLRIDRPIRVSDADFERVVAGSDVPVLVDFYADWCGPCKVMAPTIDDLAAERAGEILVGKLDTNRNPKTAARFGIRGIPTVIVFVDGNEAARVTGALGRQGLDQLVAEAVSRVPPR
jgi:thioredoxin 2